jgi:2-polyprenyl-3-methyl-5-hydroxy-6-metoxy-1,4-benzoquinol methylase
MKVAYSCVVDAKPIFEWQAFLLVKSLITNVRSEPRDIKVHCLPGVTKTFINLLSNMGVDIIFIEPFGGNHPYCNKIEQCFSAVLFDYEKVFLLDCDLFFLSKPALSDHFKFAAKIVDMPSPPLHVLKEIYEDAAIPSPKEVPVNCAIAKSDVTFEHNLNGGVYYIDTIKLDDLGKTWKKYAKWLLSHNIELGKFKNHVDQIAMGLALDELEIDVQFLSENINFPVHLPQERIIKLDAREIKVLHYHSNLLPSGQIKFTGLSKVDAVIKIANAEIESIIRQGYDNELFWNFRYDLFPELGSGIGSRDKTLAYKQELLANSVKGFLDQKVIDVGCGDLDTTKEFNFQYYTGYDLSSVALNIAQKKRPDWNFVQGSIRDNPGKTADLVICLDVLIHQKTKDEYLQLIKALANVTRKRLIISGYDSLPVAEYTSSICSYHEPLSESLNKLKVFNEITKIGEYRGLSLIVADKDATGVKLHKNDLPIEVFREILPYVERKDLLRLIIDASRNRLGFYTKTAIRAIEYPWVLEKLAEANPTEIVDIGAGVSPLPIILAEKGYSVNTIDFHPIKREFDTQSEWNEWGFLDYSLIVPTIKSFNLDILKYHPKKWVDVIYSVSVVEHMPKKTWEQLIKRAAEWLRLGGRFIITLDLIPGTELLWNISEGVEVEQIAQHGNLYDFRESLRINNFIENDFRIVRNIPTSKTDLALLDCELILKERSFFRRLINSLHLWKFG